MPRIPTFDIEDLKQGNQRDRFSECLTRHGVFFVTGCAVSEADHRSARDVAIDLFEHGTTSEKKRVSTLVPTTRRGFTSLESESTARITDTGDYTDFSMCYSMGTSQNLFPNDAFRETWETYFDLLNGVAKEIAKAVLDAVDAKLDDNGNVDEFLQCDPVLRLRYFPEVPEHRVAEKEPLRMAPHYDISTVTLIHQTPCPNGFVSLQCEIDGVYSDVPAVPDTLLVICGAVATLVSGGKIKAPRHHVVAPGRDKRVGSGRTSSVFFLRPTSNFEFDVRKARAYGLDVSLKGDRATFGEWIGGNYVNIRKA